MGSGIAQYFAQSGFTVMLFDVNETILKKAEEQVNRQLILLSEKGKINADEIQRITANIHYTNQLVDCQSDLVIEAIIENADAKATLFQQLEEINEGRPFILASNTSSLSLTELAAVLKNRSIFAGMHFFNPAPIMKLVEIVRTTYTDENALRLLLELCVKTGKTAVLCNDVPGFIVNRVARPYYLEALHLAERYQVSFETVDSIMEASGFRMGPFRLMDFIGNDINYTVSVSLFESLGKPLRLKPSKVQQEKVEAGALGKKTGTGYYDY
jgi:3-hydroxybutyryl-CoA dehydrogenase